MREERMRRSPPVLVALALLAWVGPTSAQEVHAGLGYTHIFGAGGFSFTGGYLRSLSRVSSGLQQRLGGELWYANPDVASQAPGNTGRNLVGVGARYELELARCCGQFHPLVALPLQVLHSSIEDRAHLTGGPALALVPGPESPVPAEDVTGSAWGWGAGLELGLRLSLGDQWRVQTSGTAMYQDIYAQSTQHGAWTWHVGLSYWFGGAAGSDARAQQAHVVARQ
jgi:hypothetical protein